MPGRVPAAGNGSPGDAPRPAGSRSASPLVYLAPNRWHGSRQRTQHLAEGLAGSRPVVFVEPAAYSLPGNVRRWITGDTQTSWRARFTELGRNLALFTPPASMPLSLHLRSVNRLIHRLAARQFARLSWPVAAGEIDVIIGWPPALDLAVRLRPRHLIYDCLDLFPAFHDGARARLMESLETELAQTASAVVVTSGRLEAQWSRRHPRVVRIPNGVELERFLSGPSAAPPPDDIRALPRPRLGYIGTIGSWVDFRLLTHLARHRPHCSIVLIGPVERGGRPPLDLDNIHLLGPRPYTSLPRYLASMDVLLIPFQVSELTHAVNPIKLYEYCATGKPIAGTPIEELQGDRHLFHLGQGPAGFMAAVDAALAETANPSATAARQTLARASGWRRRVCDLEGLLAQLP